MKKLFFTLLMFSFLSTLFAQTPQAVNYQGVARDANSNVLPNTNVSLRLSILAGSVSGSVSYSETQNVSTNNLGLFSIKLGLGTVVSGTFSTINWSTGIYFVKVEMDATGGSNYLFMGTSQMVSVPYALYAENAGSAVLAPSLSLSGTNLSIAGGNTVNLSTINTDAQTLSLTGNALSISAGNTVNLPANPWIQSGNNLYYNAGNVGLGVTSPAYKLDISGTLTNTVSNGVNVNFTGGNTANTRYRGIYSTVTGTGLNGDNRGVQGESVGNSAGLNTGVAGFAKNSTNNAGVYGYGSGANSTAVLSYGVYGYGVGNNLSSQYSIGVFGQGDSSSTNNGGNGVNRGVEGTATESNQLIQGLQVGSVNQGVFGIANGANGSNLGQYNYGVVGNALNSPNWNIGLFGNASGTIGTNCGVYGYAGNATTNYAGYFSGDVTVTGTFSNPSDERLKTNIVGLNSVLPLLKEINPISYSFKSENETHNLNLPKSLQYGFSAQELMTVFPNLVVENVAPGKPNKNVLASSKDKIKSEKSEQADEPFKYKSVNYIGLIPILTQAIKEQQLQIEQLQKDNAEIRALILKK